MLKIESFKEARGYEGEDCIYKSLHLNERLKGSGFDISKMNVVEILKFVMKNIPCEDDKREGWQIVGVHVNAENPKDPKGKNYCFIVLRKLV